MSIFSKSINDITWDDLNELLKDSVSESIRLEFKREVPKKDELLKKLSSFANTYGGYMIIGAAEDGKGNIVALDGVELQSNFDQKVYQWCFDAVYPPIIPVVSEAIPVKDSESKFIYVIYVEESTDSPHFLNERKGCYVRTDEYSQRLKPSLATLSEIEFLQNRRHRALQLRESLFIRARERFAKHLSSNSQKLEKAPIVKPSFSLGIVPRFPGSFIFDVKELWQLVTNTSMSARETVFPSGRIESQPDSFYFMNPRQLGVSYLEINVHGFIYYHQDLTGVIEEDKNDSSKYLRVSKIFSWVIFYLKYSRKFFKEFGYDGSIYLRIELIDIAGFPFIMPFPTDHAEAARLDNTIQIEDELQMSGFRDDLSTQLRRILKIFCFNCGHRGAFEANDHAIDTWFKECLGYLMWNELE